MAKALPEGLISWTATWSDPDLPPTADSLTTGHLAIQVADETVWKGIDFEWNWIELLEWLSNSWRWLLGEDGVPFDLAPLNFEDFKQRAGQYGDDEGALLWEFQETHELGASLRGAWTPASLMVWREGLIGHILTNEAHYMEPWGQTRSSLEDLGEVISDRLTPALGQDERADKAREAWSTRRRIKATELVQMTGLDGTAADMVVSLIPKDGLDADALATDELLAVAKMSAALPPSAVRSIVGHLRDIPKVDTQAVDEVAQRVRDAADLTPDDLPHEQALEIARAFRQVVGLDTNKPFHADRWLRDVGVHLMTADLGTSLVRALAAWGSSHGPGVLVNSGHRRFPSNVRADLAHEVCHLLMDRDAAVPAADVLAGGSDRAAEKRANAFAAEMLMPRVVAVEAFEAVTSEVEARKTVNSLTSRFQVSRQIVAWQTLNSGLPLSPDARATLWSLAHPPSN